MGSLNISSRAPDWRGRALSSFAHSPFVLRLSDDCEVSCESFEGFWQGLKWPPDSLERQKAFACWGARAKRAGRSAPQRPVEICGQLFEVGSPAHLDVALAALRAKARQNEFVAAALRSTIGLTLTHTIQTPAGTVMPDSTTLPAQRLIDMWIRIRGELFEESVSHVDVLRP